MPGDILAVVGGQYGSEGKGVVVNHIAKDYNCHVRVGGPNAGHSFYHQGKLYKMQVVPCGWTNPSAQLVLGRGMVVDFDQLVKEVNWLLEVDPTVTTRLWLDPKAGVLHNRHYHDEGGVHGDLHHRIGSTGKGVGAARRDRMDRDDRKTCLAEEVADQYKFANGKSVRDILGNTVTLVNDLRESGVDILLEGTQGSGLSLIHGPWPYVTSADTNAAQMAADVGIPPRYVNRTMLVLRTFPIRVAGNSGPLKGEMSWEDMSKRVGKTVEERTTVTLKTRRIGEWDHDLFIQSCMLNAPTSLAIMFLDYLEPSDEGVTEYQNLSEQSKSFCHYLTRSSGVPVVFGGTGGDGWKICQIVPGKARP